MGIMGSQNFWQSISFKVRLNEVQLYVHLLLGLSLYKRVKIVLLFGHNSKIKLKFPRNNILSKIIIINLIKFFF